MRSLLIVCCAGSVASAAPKVYSEEPVVPASPADAKAADEAQFFIGVDDYSKIGVGVAFDRDDVMPTAHYDYSLRLGKVFHAHRRWRPGAFVELHSLDLDTFDATVGPQLQMRVGGDAALQWRAGIGIGSEGTHTLAGLSFGKWMYGVGVTARRSFDTGDVVVAANLELTGIAPVALALGFLLR